MIKVVCLELSTYVGYDPDASHYFAKLIGDDKRVVLKHRLTTKEAALRSKRGGYTWRKGQETERFASENKAIQFAIKNWKKHFPDGVVLLESENGIRDPAIVLVAPEQLKKKLDVLYAEALAIDFYEKNVRKMEKISSQWNKLIDNI